jgi:uncharacterized protein
MRRLPARSRIACLLAALLLNLAAFAAAQESQPWSQNTSPLPPPTGHVNDYAGVIDTATKQQLENRLRAFKESSEKHVEIAVAVVRTTGDRPIFDYSLAVYRGWGIGSKADDNPGALLLVAIDDRKYFTQVGKDLEDELPDGLVGSLQRQYLVPEFKKGNYSKGISDTIEAYINAIEGKTATSEIRPESPGEYVADESNFGFFCCAIIFIVIIVIVFSRSKGGPTKGDRDRWGGGGFGCGGSGVSGALPWIIGSIVEGIASSSSSSGSSSSWGGSSGGSDWGGFGGGGDSGGGGAGGGW